MLENLVGLYRLCRNPALLWQEICRQKDYYFIYNHRLLLAVGSMFSHYLTEYAVINVLMWYLTIHKGDLAISAVLASIHYALALLLVILTSNLAYLVVGRFQTLLLCDIAYLGGLVMFWLLVPSGVNWVIVVALVLLAIGKSGFLLLDELVVDLMDDIDDSQDRTRERSIKRKNVWSRITKMFASIVATLWVAPNALGKIYPSWDATFLTCIIVMTMILLTFVIGYRCHPQERLTERSSSPLLRVLCAGIQKCISWRCFVNPTRHDERSQSLDTTGQLEARWKNEDNKAEIKHLLLMVPMWVIYLVVALMLAAKNTFFYEQYSNLKTPKYIPIQIYDVAFRFSVFAIPCLYSWIHGSRKNDKLKIGFGLLCAIISCVIAWQLEVRRLKAVKALHDVDKDYTSISFLWLVPQFCFLGGMYGLVFEGLSDFRSQVQEEGIRSHRYEFMLFLEGIAVVIHIFFILIFEHEVDWIGVSINKESRLDNYFLVLACICLASFIIYCYIGTRFYKDAEQSQEKDNDSKHNQELSERPDLRHDHRLQTINDSRHEDHQHLANDDAQQDHPVLAIDDSKQDHPVLVADDSQQDQKISMIDNWLM